MDLRAKQAAHGHQQHLNKQQQLHLSHQHLHQQQHQQQQHHHVACLSASSQTLLISPMSAANADTASERATPISARLLPLASAQAPAPPGSAGLVGGAAAGATFFFPPLPSRTTKSRPGVAKPRLTDINMNSELERDREQHASSRLPNTSPRTEQLSAKPPLNSPARTFAGFFNEPNLFSSPASASASSPAASQQPTDWLGQHADDNYHIYHEPMDPDEDSSAATVTNTAKPTPPPLEPLRAPNKHPPLPSPLASPPRINTSKSLEPLAHCQSPSLPAPNSVTANSAANSDAVLHRDWPASRRNGNNKVPQQTNRSPTFVGSQITTTRFNPKPTSNSFSNRAGVGQRNDISADIYFCYVTLKANERASYRSKSYHGSRSATKTPATTSHAHVKDAPDQGPLPEVPPSPTAFASNMVPIQLRDHCVRELIETESNYVHALDMIINCFIKPLELLLKREDNPCVKNIFSLIKYFQHVHSSFQAELINAAFRSYNKDHGPIPSNNNNRTSLSNQQSTTTNQNNSGPSTPTSSGCSNQQFQGSSALGSPIIEDVASHNAGQQHATQAQQGQHQNKSSNGNSSKISSCFLNNKEKFLKYGEYCATLSKAQTALDELTNKNEAIAVQLDRCQQEANEGKFRLRDLLSLPMQRILKYHLLLAQLVKETSTTSDDFAGLKRAHEAMVDLGRYINEVKRDTEAIQIINDIEQSITGLNMPPNTQLTDYGRLATDGFIRIKAPTDGAKNKSQHESKMKLAHDIKSIKQKRYVFVFDKVILMCKLSGLRGYQYKEALILNDYELDANPSSIQHETTAKHLTKDKWTFNFNLIRISDRSAYTFYAKTTEMKNKWIDAIKKAMDNVRPLACRNNDTNHEFLMHTFDKASSCEACGKLLLGLYYQGYRCRNCFASAHKKCLSSIKPCGPILPPRPFNTLSAQSNVRSKEPPSPSVRSNCSDDSHNMFLRAPGSNSSSVQCMDTIARNEYSNIANRFTGGDIAITPSASFRDDRSRPTFGQRPVSSMINVSQQNSSSHMLRPDRVLQGSCSTPTISNSASFRAKAIAHYDGDENIGQMRVISGDILIVYKNSTTEFVQRVGCMDHIDKSMSNLSMTNTPTDSLFWFGKNIRTGKEGQFPFDVVEVIGGEHLHSRTHNDKENFNSENKFISELDDGMQRTTGASNSYANGSMLNEMLDYPWFCGRMERDKAQALLQDSPHGSFLVRVSPKHNGSYVISLNYNSQVMHMRIYVSRDNQLYLSENRYFKSVPELVHYYGNNSLVESFNKLDAYLAIPFKST